MAMRRLIIICLLALSAVALPVSSASAAKGPKPVITKVSPMRVSVGKLLTIYGRNFKPGVNRNTVIFRASNGRTVFGKPVRASRTKLVVRVPTGASRLLSLENSQQQPTRLKLRALAGKFSAFTVRRLSPVVVPNATGEGCERRTDFDSDLLTNQEELDTTKTDPCNPDTDADGIIDGWEFWSAKDLNIKAVPYPGRRPFPNPLDPSDGLSSIVDFDGDGLTTGEEFRAWKVSGSSFDRSNLSKGPSPPDHESVLGYSDGTQASRPNETPRVPDFRSNRVPNYGMPNPPYEFPAFYDFEPGAWWDFERDADADGLNNFIESSRGPGQASWWGGYFGQEAIQIPAWPKVKPGCAGQSPGDFTTRRPFLSLDLGDADVDGDTLLDGEDDQDNDDWINIVELYETQKDVDGNGNVVPAEENEDGELVAVCAGVELPTINRDGFPYVVNAFNPCAPNPRSRTCPYYKPFN
jgi:IPT/TIG domain